MKRVLYRARLVVNAAVLMASGVAGCAVDEVVVATAFERDAGPSSRARGCATNTDCHASELCAKSSCDQPTGACRRRPLFCDPQGSPSCGCNGVTYWNDCLREQGGVEAATMGECTDVAAPCSDPRASDCPVPGASCARLLPAEADCSADAAGVCWILPAICPADLPADFWISCADSTLCVDTCTAIRSSVTHQHVSDTCP
jgi:hypothetical protein